MIKHYIVPNIVPNIVSMLKKCKVGSLKNELSLCDLSIKQKVPKCNHAL